jgi:hypothetical protein
MTHSEAELISFLVGFITFFLLMILIGIILISEDIKNYIEDKE